MANDGQHSDPPELSWVDEFDEVLRVANPNPDRAGCPPRDVLIAVSRRERPIGDPAYEHLLKCSPCYSEFRSMRQAGGQHRAGARARTWWLATAAALLLLAAGGWLFFPRPQESVRPAAAP